MYTRSSTIDFQAFVARSPSALLCVCFFAFCAGCSDDLPGKPVQAKEPTELQAFQQIYALRCAACHGSDGRLGAGPPLNDPLYLALASDDDLRAVIADGRHGTLMPAWDTVNGGPLSDAQVTTLVHGMRKQWTPKDTATVYPSAPPLVPRDGAAGNPQTGLTIFAVACGECHGADGMGDMAGRLNDPTLLALMSDRLLRRYVITGRPDLDMPNFAEADGRPESFTPLTDQQVNDLVALFAQWRKQPTSP